MGTLHGSCIGCVSEKVTEDLVWSTNLDQIMFPMNRGKHCFFGVENTGKGKKLRAKGVV